MLNYGYRLSGSGPDSPWWRYTLCECPYCLCATLSLSAVGPVHLCITPATETDRGMSNTGAVLKQNIYLQCRPSTYLIERIIECKYRDGGKNSISAHRAYLDHAGRRSTVTFSSYLRKQDNVLPGVCLSVCLSVSNCTEIDRIFMKMLSLIHI